MLRIFQTTLVYYAIWLKIYTGIPPSGQILYAFNDHCHFISLYSGIFFPPSGFLPSVFKLSPWGKNGSGSGGGGSHILHRLLYRKNI